MGDDADDILRSFGLTEDEKKVYATVKQKFESHFVKRRNTIFERAKFNMRKQEEKEPVDAFVTDLYALAEHCSYGALHDEMIRDRLVVGLRDAKLSERLQLDAELTLNKAVNQVRQAEAIKKQQIVIRSEGDSLPIGSVQNHKGKTFIPRKTAPLAKGKICSWCGKSWHDRTRCPAKDAVCGKCQKKGHYSRVCRSTGSVDAVHQEESSEESDEAFLGTVGECCWKIKLKINNCEETFHIDTGAEVSVIPESTYAALGSPKLSQSRRVLRGPGQNKLQVQGMLQAELILNNQQTEHVVKDYCHE